VTKEDGTVEVQDAYNKRQLRDINEGMDKARVDARHELREQSKNRKKRRSRLIWKMTTGGQWVVVGPSHVVKVDRMVTVSGRRDLPRRIRIRNVGKEFRRNGRTMVYGYVDPDEVQRGRKVAS